MNPARAFSKAALYTDEIDYRLVHLPPAYLGRHRKEL